MDVHTVTFNGTYDQPQRCRDYVSRKKTEFHLVVQQKIRTRTLLGTERSLFAAQSVLFRFQLVA
jgi:hypothetical protein